LSQSKVKLLEVKDVEKIFSVKVGTFEKKDLHALNKVSFNIFKGKTLSGTLQKDVQMIFQDPYSSLNPRKKIKTILEQPLKIHTKQNKKERMKTMLSICDDVGIDHTYLER